MASIPANVIFWFNGNHADIPSGWSRETTLDAKYVKSYGDSVVPNETGGEASHTHTSPSHTHTIVSHTHSYSLDYHADQWPDSKSGAPGSGEAAHSHGTANSGVPSGGDVSSTVTYASVNNDPPYHTLIPIKASSGATIPNKLIAYLASASIPTNWYACDGNNSTPNLTDKYIKGAGTGANAGSTGGSTTNVHTINHTHSAATHTHVAANSAASNNAGGSPRATGSGEANMVSKDHIHSVTMAASSQGLVATTVDLTTTETVEPAYKKLFAIQKAAGGLKAKGIIGMWLGETANIPRGWLLCNGDNDTQDLRDKQIKVTNTEGHIGDTGGSNTHSHAEQSHALATTGTHTHTGAGAGHTNTLNDEGTSDGRYVSDNPHTFGTISSVTATYANANTTGESSSNEPAYRTAAYIQFNTGSEGGAFLLNLI